MAPRPRAPRAVLAAAIAALLAAGCAAPAAPPPAAIPMRVEPAAQAGMGLVRVDLRAVEAAWGAGRRLQTISEKSPATQVQLAVRGPGMSERTSAAMALGQGGVVGNGTLTLQVPAGFNRVFELRGLNADNKVVKRMRGLTDVTAAQEVNVVVTVAHDAAARVVEDLLGTSGAGSAASALETQSLAAPLDAFISNFTDAEGGTTAPYFKSRELAARLRASGMSALTTELLDEGFFEPELGTVRVQVKDQANGQSLAGADVVLISPYHDVFEWQTKADGTFEWDPVPPGSWTLRVRYDGVTKYVAVEPALAAGLTTVEMEPFVQTGSRRLLFERGLAAQTFSVPLAPALSMQNGARGGNDRAVEFAPNNGPIDWTLTLATAGETVSPTWTRLHVKARGTDLGPAAVRVELMAGANALVGGADLGGANGIAPEVSTFSDYSVNLADLVTIAGDLATADGVRFTAPGDVGFVLDEVWLDQP